MRAGSNGAALNPRTSRVPPLGSVRYAGPRDPSFWLSGFRRAMNAQGLPTGSPIKYNVWVARALRTIADNLSQVPFILRRGSKAAEAREIESGPWYELFERPNPFCTGPELWQFTTYQLYDIPGGASYWVLESGEDKELSPTDIPKEIWPMSKGCMTPVFSEDGKRTIGYIVEAVNRKTNQVGRMSVSAHNVIVHRFVDPSDIAGSMSPLEAAMSSVRQDFQAAAWNEAFFRNDATPGLLLTTKDPLTPDQRDANRKEWELLHEGVARSHRAAILEGGLTAQVVGTSHTEMGFRGLREWNREEVASATGVPKWFLGVTSDINYATAKSAERVLWTAVLMPLAKMLARNLDFQLFRARDPLDLRTYWMERVPAMGSAEVWGEFDTTTVEALRADLNEKLDSAAKLRGLSYSMNEINETLELGMPPQEHGDVPMIQGGWMPLRDVVSGLAGLLEGIGTESASEAAPDQAPDQAPANEVIDPTTGKPWVAESEDSDGVGGGDNAGAEVPDAKDRPRAWRPDFAIESMMESIIFDAASNMTSVRISDYLKIALDAYRNADFYTVMNYLTWALERSVEVEPPELRFDLAARVEKIYRLIEKASKDFAAQAAQDAAQDHYGLHYPRHFGGLPGARGFDRGNTQRRALIWETMNVRIFRPGERAMLAALAKLLKRIQRDTLKSLGARSQEALEAKIAKLQEEWARLMRELGAPVLRNAAFAGLNELDNQLPYFISIDMKNPAVVFAIAENERGLKDVSEGVAKFMRLSLAQGYAEGEGLDKLADRVRATIATAGNYAPRIARDEVSHAVNSVRHSAIEETPYVTGAEWISSRDDAVRPTHVRLDGQTRPPHGTYPNVSGLPGGALRYPQDPQGPDSEVKGCRCVEAPVVDFNA